MAQQSIPVLPVGPWLNSDRTPTVAFRSVIESIIRRLGGTVDKVDLAATQAAAAVPKTTEIISIGGLQIGGNLGDHVAVALYKTVCAVAALPTTGNEVGDHAFALDGRNSGEGAGAGTGCEVVWSGSLWRINGTATAVAA